ncbi:origin recognition complex subunit [Sporothrix brasiliensis 5110]|uniref:Origin recognition complex subunit n=1 Tax=Sporothrix brasiliensis 5110 TaxID=1398154 RepID=A0A0C2F9R6_9PEZI|nr:origin recognition complex subunit [Sporothrix brasiliensis 5110]KIH87828.1 origin recognition complex subunit [Sporothrix brasiliensis 5110]
MAALAGEDAETSIVHRSIPANPQKVAYIFNPSDDEDDEANNGENRGATTSPSASRSSRKHGRTNDRTPKSKKRRTAKGKAKVDCDGDGDGEQDREGDGDENAGDDNALASFPPLLQGREASEAVARRRQLFNSLWAQLDDRIQTVLQRSNQATLSAVMDFIEKPTQTKLPAAFVILGPAATTDMLLFRQLSASLTESEKTINRDSSSKGKDRCVRRMVRLRAAEAPNLRAALKTIVQVASSAPSPGNGVDDGADEDDVVAHNGNKYLAYDLEAVAAAISDPATSRIVVAFEDSEAFDGALLADLISFLHSWFDRIPFVLLFGVATSVDLFQARLPKQAAHRLSAAQFDIAPSSAVLDRLAERQDEQVAGVSVFVNSLKEKYAYMCYFYANPLSVFLHDIGDSTVTTTQDTLLQNTDYLTAFRQLPSFRRHVKALVTDGDIDVAKQLLSDKPDQQQFLRQAVAGQMQYQRRWNERIARAVHLAAASGVFPGQSFTELYITALEDQRGANEDGFTLDDDDSSLAATMTTAIRRMTSSELVTVLRRLIAAAEAGDAELALEAPPDDTAELAGDMDPYQASWATLPSNLAKIAGQIEELQKKLEASYANRARSRIMSLKAAGGGPSSPGGGGGPPQLRSKYTAQSKVLRTTVVAQKVQLSRDSMALTEEDQTFTELVDAAVAAVVGVVDVEPATASRAAVAPSSLATPSSSPASRLWLQEVWLYNAQAPYRDVFIPRPGLVVERALARPHDYLACECCAGTEPSQNTSSKKNGDTERGSIRPTLPATAILYQLYLDAGPLINVADLWEAFQNAVSENGNRRKDKDGNENKNKEAAANNGDNAAEGEEEAEDNTLERRHLVQFYQGLSEMKTLGYIKPTRRKVDHVAKIKWL